MPFRTTCPACGKSLAVPEEKVGQPVPCPACKKIFVAGGVGLGASPTAADPLAGNPLMGNPLQTHPLQGNPLMGSPWSAPQPAAPAQPATKESKSWFLPAVIGGGVLVLALVMGGVWFLTRNKQQPVAKEPAAPAKGAPARAQPAETPKPKIEFKLLAIERVSVEQGAKQKFKVTVERGGVNGPIELAADDLPPKITLAPAQMGPAASSIDLELSADDDAEVGDNQTVHITASAGETKAQQQLTLQVTALVLPKLAPLAAATLKPGGTATIDVSLERNGHAGPLTLAVQDLPEKVTAKPLVIEAGKDDAKLELSAAADAKEIQRPIRLVATAKGKQIQTQGLLAIESFPYRLAPLPVVKLKPGETKSIDVAVQRRSYKGALQVTLEGLPEHVTAKPLEIAAGAAAGKLELTAAAEATDKVRTAAVLAKGETNSITEPLVIRISSGEGTFLPKDVTADPELARLLKRGSFGGRLETASKQALLDIYGGTSQSEAAVLRGLKWLAAHQSPSGGWSCDKYHEHAKCDCHKPFEAEVKDYPAAGTAFGLLPFLGAGVTHNRAPSEPKELADYKEVVEKGLRHLTQIQKANKDLKLDGELPGGMYAHALGTIALCEAYGLSQDERLKVPAQRAVRYLVQAQNPTSGAWWYTPRPKADGGDMSVVGWVFLAIRSGQLAGIQFDRTVIEKAGRFLNNVSAETPEHKFARYCYQPGKPFTPTLTSAGLLSRQYSGWEKEREDLIDGCNYLMQNLPPESGPRLGSIYYYYYATQVLHHMEGDNWDKWNLRMREHLIRTQEQSGHAEGSWNPEGTDHGGKGGRLYSTSLALCTLEVYYRHLPLYRRAVKVEAP